MRTSMFLTTLEGFGKPSGDIEVSSRCDLTTHTDVCVIVKSYDDAHRALVVTITGAHRPTPSAACQYSVYRRDLRNATSTHSA